MGCKVVILLLASLLLAFSSSVSSRTTLPTVLGLKGPKTPPPSPPKIWRPKVPPPPPTIWRPPPPPPQEQNFNKLVQTWAPGYCLTKPCAHFEELGFPKSFFIHGLWPQNCLSTKPINSKTLHDIQILMDNNHNLQDQMNKYWSALNFVNNKMFWLHEWNKHGSCQTSLSLQDYFQRTLQLTIRTDLLNTLKEKNIVPGKPYKEPVFKKAIHDKTGQEPLLRCGNGNVLSEVVLCVDEQAQNFIPCPGQSSASDPSKCKQGDVMFQK